MARAAINKQEQPAPEAAPEVTPEVTPEVAPEPAPEAAPEEEPPLPQKTVGTYRVVTDRQPFFDGVPMKQNHLFHAPPDDPAVIAMLERTWIVKAG